MQNKTHTEKFGSWSFGFPRGYIWVSICLVSKVNCRVGVIMSYHAKKEDIFSKER